MAFNFKVRPLGGFWQHDSAPVWIVKYDAIRNERAEFWKAYRAVEPVPAGRAPYTVNNKVLGGSHGFHSLEDAMKYCEDFIAGGHV